MMDILICDDDDLLAQALREKVERLIGQACCVRICLSAFAAETWIADEAHGAVDILLADIRLPDENGIAMCRRVKQAYPHIAIIFVTNYLEYAVDVFDAEPVYFITKPVSDERLQTALRAACRKIQHDGESFLVAQCRGNVLRVRHSDIVYMESDRRTLLIHEGSETHRVYGKLDDYEKTLPSYFLRCHQSFIVNLARVRMLGTDGFYMLDGSVVPISRKRCGEIKHSFLQYLSQTLTPRR